MIFFSNTRVDFDTMNLLRCCFFVYFVTLQPNRCVYQSNVWCVYTDMCVWTFVQGLTLHKWLGIIHHGCTAASNHLGISFATLGKVTFRTNGLSSSFSFTRWVLEKDVFLFFPWSFLFTLKHGEFRLFFSFDCVVVTFDWLKEKDVWLGVGIMLRRIGYMTCINFFPT